MSVKVSFLILSLYFKMEKSLIRDKREGKSRDKVTYGT